VIHIFSAKGRMRRRTYIIINLILSVPSILLYFLMDNVHSGDDLFFVVCLIGIFIAMIQWIQIIKRFHDINYRGWTSLLLFVPIVNIGGSLLLMFKDGTKGPNRFGEDPKERTPDAENIEITESSNEMNRP
jgi:uncharacterized membrane protein YhaH (DUF805 family)